MKELSIEEKAKTYDGNYKAYTELINRLEDVKDAIKKQNYGIAMDILYKPYPVFQITTSTELKESEDERIRKAVIAAVETLSDSPLKVKMLAWLEKQAEHANFINNIQVGDKVTRNEDGVLVNLSQLNRVAKKDEKQGKNNMGISETTKQKLEDNLNKALEKETPESLNKFIDEHGSQILANSAKTCKDGQKPADTVEPNLLTIERAKEMSPFMKSGFENESATWSEDDEKILNLIIARLHSHPNVEAEEYGKDYHWFKALKDRYTWRPSERQKEALLWCVVHLGGADKQTLGELLEELNKL